jgi:uncharacterized protein with FMN-binding domain
MKKKLKWISITVLVLVAVMAVYATFGLQQTLALQMQDVDLTAVADGNYTGSYESYRWSTTVTVTVKDHQITAIQPDKIQSGRANLAEELTQSILSQQRTAVDAVSGATASSNSFLKAVETALTAPATTD